MRRDLDPDPATGRQQIQQGLIHGSYNSTLNDADLHVDAKGGGAGLSPADMLTVARDLNRVMTARKNAGGPDGRFLLHPTGAAIVKIVVELLGQALGGTWNKMLANAAQWKRKTFGGGGAKSMERLSPDVLTEHFLFLDSLRGSNMVSVTPRIMSPKPEYKLEGTQAEKEAEFAQDMMKTTPEGERRYAKYKANLADPNELMGVSLDISLRHTELPAIIAVLEKAAH